MQTLIIEVRAVLNVSSYWGVPSLVQRHACGSKQDTTDQYLIANLFQQLSSIPAVILPHVANKTQLIPISDPKGGPD